MGLLLLFAVVLVGAAVALVARSFALNGVRREETFTQIARYGFSAKIAEEIDPSDHRGLRAVADPLARRIGTLASRHLSGLQAAEIQKLLRAAGLYQTDVELFLGYRLLVAAGLPGLWLFLSIAGGNFGARTLLLVCFVGAMAWVLPSFVLKRRAAQRLEQIDLEMPELVDLLVTTVEAGVGFAASLQLVARRVEGPLGQEIRIALREQTMGLTIEDALQNMLLRVDSASIRAFVQAIIQGQKLGVSIGKILRDLAIDMRKRRRQMAEERAQKAPTKILFPLVFLILPALFIVVLGGPILSLGKTLGSLA